MVELYTYRPGRTPVLIDIPHAGRHLPPEIAERMSEAGTAVPDTDWHVERLYDFAEALGVGVMAATHSRYVVDLNRAPDDAALYADAVNTGLVPRQTFDGTDIYQDGQAPDAMAVALRLEAYWQPYHAALRATLDEIKAQYGKVVLIDAHSIRSQVPRLFEGRLPDLNFGTARGHSADRVLAAEMFAVLEQARGFRAVRDARFTGGYITRHYGRPGDGVHAAQLELAQITYMEERPPFRYKPDEAATLKPILRRMVEVAVAWATA
jgi:N-formylglutamate deformylase